MAVHVARMWNVRGAYRV